MPVGGSDAMEWTGPCEETCPAQVGVQEKAAGRRMASASSADYPKKLGGAIHRDDGVARAGQ
jgi:hypothetical protein